MEGHSAQDARRALHVPDSNSESHGESAVQGYLVGRILGGCRLVRLLNAGGMGEIYLGEQIRLGNRFVAVKVVYPIDAVASAGQTIPHMEDRFMREARLLGQFYHPNILPVHDSGRQDGYLYLVMQYTPDGSLSDAIRGIAPHRLNLPVRLPLAVDIIGQIASALQYTHDHGIVHRDVKPANVLVQREPNGHRRMLLADFGIAHGMESATQKTQITGTVAYMAPEQFDGNFSPASDQYALAVMTYLLLTGRPPFTGNVAEVTRAHLYDMPFPLRSFNPNVPYPVGQVVARALSKDPMQRYPSVSAFAQAFRRAAAGNEEAADATVPGAFPPSVADDGAERAADTPAVLGAALNQAATRTARDRGTQPADTVLVRPSGETKVVGVGAERATRSMSPSPILPGSTSGDGVRGIKARATTRRRDGWRQAAIFLLSAALLGVALVAAIKLGPLYTSHGFTFGSQTKGIIATHTAQVTPSPAETTPTATTQPTIAPDKANLVALNAPQKVAPRQRFTVTFTIANSGTNPWSEGDGYRLICDTLNHPQNYCPRSLSIGLGNQTIAPGQHMQFSVALVAPSQPGTYTVWVNMSHNDALFSTPDVAAHFAVQIPPRPASTSTPRPAPTSTPRPAPTSTPKPEPTATPAPAATETPIPSPTATNAPASTSTPATQPTFTTAPAPTSSAQSATAAP